MMSMGPQHDEPVSPSAGLSAARERRWGVWSGVVGAVFGLGAALIAVLVEGAPWFSAGGTPDFFALRRLLVFDAFLVAGLVVGLGCVAAGGVAARFGRYPRTDGFAGVLLGLILAAISSLLIFTRLTSVIRSSGS